MPSAYDFSFLLLNGEKLELGKLLGKVLLIVNTASECGFTPQLKDLELLHQEYKDKGLVVIAIPSNDFGGQEPGTIEDITHTACEIFHATYYITQKYHIAGVNAHPFYTWVNKEVGFLGRPRWNFHKIMIGKSGKLIDWFSSATKPTNKKLKEAIDEALAE
ncbi:MAG: glutathione peroxidase [Alphaproteobacteria bacterium]|nr:MAG: glutathione peroxidase [Alphaproteobacteria bacterium]